MNRKEEWGGEGSQRSAVPPSFVREEERFRVIEMAEKSRRRKEKK